jgi:hypothetical protein
MAKKHFSFIKTIKMLADGQWGTEASDTNEAMQKLAAHPEKITGWAMVELIRRFNLFLASMRDPGGGGCRQGH